VTKTRKGVPPKLTRGERVIAFIEKYCRVPEGDLLGQPMRLLPFQRRFILEVYDNPHGTRVGILSIGRKNGKTGLIAAILLAHVAGPEAIQNSQIVSGAMSQKQAAVVFKYATKIIRLSPELSRLVRVKTSAKQLVGLARNVEYSAISREKKTAQGLSPVLGILDEVGQIRGAQDDFVEAIETAQGAYDEPLLLLISTQASKDTDLLSIRIDDALKSKDPHTVCHVHAAPPDCDLMDRKAWKVANPALGVFRSEKDVAAQAKAAARMPSNEAGFRNLTLNQRVETSSPLIARSVWIANSFEPDEEAFRDNAVWCGLDLSSRTDLTAFVRVALFESRWHVKATFWTPEKGLHERAKRDRQDYPLWVKRGLLRTTPGASVDYDVVAEELGELLEGMNVAGVAFDRWRMDVMLKSMARVGVDFPMQPWGQGFKDMSPAIDALENALLNDQMSHGNHPVLTMCAANAVASKDEAGNRKLNKLRSNGRIDGIVALAMALGLAHRATEEEGLGAFLENPIIT
jgi:phage terminase large subunit-like protein